MGSEVLLFVEIQQLGRVFFELGVRGGGRDGVDKGRQFPGPRYELLGDVRGLLTDCCIDARLCLPLVVVRITIGGCRGFSRAT